MMIRINLLPVRQVQKREISRQFLVLVGVVLLLAGILNYLAYERLASEADRNAKKITQTQARINELEKVIGEVNNINKRKKEVEDKLKVLSDLRKGRSGPVRLMDALSTAIPKKVWLTDFDEKSNAVKITGLAASHEDVAEFMRSLANVCWTAKGMGRLVDQKRDAKTARVELLASGGSIEDFKVMDVGFFFTNIELKKAEQKEAAKKEFGGGKMVDFEINLSANYAI
ncbi:MAG TPA: PilN domain-containing protein [Myxococcaceae bacterium]|nr:PilN domain-containing protein [Myxococcaceae bacterium]